MMNQIYVKDEEMFSALRQYLDDVRIPYLGKEPYSMNAYIRWTKSPKALLNDFEKKYQIDGKPITGSIIETMVSEVDAQYKIDSKKFSEIKNETDTFQNISEQSIYMICVAFILTEEDRNKLLDVFHIHVSPKYYDQDAIFEFFTKNYQYSLTNINNCQFDLSVHQEVIRKFIDCINYGTTYIQEYKDQQRFKTLENLLWRDKNGE